jgi:hypothetical protein
MPLHRKIYPAAIILLQFSAIEKDDEEIGCRCLPRTAVCERDSALWTDIWKNFHHGLHLADNSDIRAGNPTKI